MPTESLSLCHFSALTRYSSNSLFNFMQNISSGFKNCIEMFRIKYQL